MKRKSSIALFLLAAIYLVLHFIQSRGLGSEHIRFYGKDIILVPFLILGISAIREVLKLSFNISLKELITTTIYCIVAFEIVLPKFGMAFEADILDIFCYILGAAIFYFTSFKLKDRIIDNCTYET